MLDREQTQEYVNSFRTPFTSNIEVCVDGRTPTKNAGDIARGGGTLGVAFDVIDALAEQGIQGYSSAEILGRMIAIARSTGGRFGYHTDSHADSVYLKDPVYDPIGCIYAAVMREHGQASRDALGYTRTRTSFEVDKVVLQGEHKEMAVVINNDLNETIPHQVEDGRMIFLWDRAKDAQRIALYVARLEIPGLLPEVVERMAERNVVETLANISTAQGLGMYLIRSGKDLQVESIGKVGS